MSTETILVNRDGHIVTVTLNRPEKLNALTKPMWRRLGDVFTELSADASIGAPDFSDQGLIQYLRTQRIVPPYQSRGYKLVELIRIYLVGIEPSS